MPPRKYRLFGEKGEFWTDENCRQIENQTLCTATPEPDKCHISYPHTCNFLQTTNDYKVIKQLSNNKVLISTRKPSKIMEICKEEIKQEIINGSVLVSSGGNNCRIIVDQMKFDNTYSNYTYRTPLETPLANFKMNKSVKLQQKHLEDFFTS
ncbi:hypothetical protein TcasGA2_TC011586 [Tribolium castaneum]|uniref:Uncharacterized protein n=1 Tax=Tribolium castaneum TaxID=7070 RepID=D7EKC5_TRICA|nr:hypothetical protein TcasGA2_TC011586 [Tribolium castaneum]